MKTITAEMLREKGASCSQVQCFQKLFPNGATVTPENCLRVVEAGLDIDWFISTFLQAPALAEYKKAKATALAEYKKATATALAKYEKAKATALAEYKKAKATALAKYEKAKAPAWAEYKKATATALFNILKEYWN